MTSINLASEIERFRERLLDLSLRNPLLSYRKSKRKTLQFDNKQLDEIYQSLVGSGKALVLDFVSDPQTCSEPSLRSDLASEMAGAEKKWEKKVNEEIWLPPDTPLLPASNGKSLELDDCIFDNKLKTRLNQDRLAATIRFMHRDAETAMQETGINYLFLAIGFIAWRESDSSEKERLAPLILVPVQIEKESRGNGEPRFTVKWDEDEIQFNVSLQKKFARDFDLKLPEFAEESLPEAYFEEIQAALHSKKHWSIKREVLLGFFSFHKLSMYADIAPENWKSFGSLLEDLVSGTDREASEVLSDPALYAPDYDIDRHPIVDNLRLALDADSSQQSALVDIRNGKSLVIEGPPGTGKSQTITNAIADAIASGKSVLFVAEKLAALQVVYDRMEALGLNDFCLDLHSDGASPRHVFESLSERLGGTYPLPENISLNQKSLAERRDQLNAYVAEMATKVGPEGDPLYGLLWRVVGLRDEGAQFVPKALVHFPVDRNHFQRNSSALTSFAKVIAEVPAPQSSPWWGFVPEGFAYRQVDHFRESVGRIQNLASQVRTSIASIVSTWDISQDRAYWLTSNLDVSQLQDCLKNRPDRSHQLTSHLTVAEQASESRKLLELIKKQVHLRDQLDRQSTADSEAILEQEAPLTDFLVSLDWDVKAKLSSVPETLNWLQAIYKEVTQIEASAEILAKCGRSVSNLTPDYRHSITLVQLIRHSLVKDRHVVTAAMFNELAGASYKAAKLTHDSLLAKRQRIQMQVDSVSRGVSYESANFAQIRNSVQKTEGVFKQHSLQQASISQIKEMLQWATSADTSLKQISDIGSRFDGELIPRASDFETYVTGSMIVQLARHSVVGQHASIVEAMFQNEAWNTFEEASKIADGLRERRQHLETSFHLPSIPDPEEITGIVRSLRRARKSWFRFLNRDYRKSRSKLDEFVAVGKKLTLDDCIRSLENLNTLTKDEMEFRTDVRYCAHLGPGFRGIETDWETLKARLAWVRKIRQYGFDFPRASKLLERKATLIEDISNRDLRRVEANFRDQWLNDSSPAHVVLSTPIGPSMFTALQERLQIFISSATALLHAADVAGVMDSWTVRQLFELIDAWKSLAILEAEEQAFQSDSTMKMTLGDYFNGAETDWDQLNMVLNWARMAKDHGATFELCNRLFDQREDLLTDFDVPKATECVKRIDNLLDNQPLSLLSSPSLEQMSPSEGLAFLSEAIAKVDAGSQMARRLFTADEFTIDDAEQAVSWAVELHDLARSIENPDDWSLTRSSGLYDVIVSDQVRVHEVFEWMRSIDKLMGNLPAILKAALLETGEATEILDLCTRVKEIGEKGELLRDERTKLEQFGRINCEWLRIGPRYILAGTTESECSVLLARFDELPQWAEYCRATQECEKHGLGEFCKLVVDGTLPSIRLVSTYQLTVFEREVEEVFNKSELLRGHSGHTLQGVREEFQKFDNLLRDCRKDEIASLAADRIVPTGNSRGRVSELTELALIRHESNKQRRHCRIRDLISRAGAAVQALKPCFMMSPLSVSRFIPQGTIFFDLVIMDEASQIKPEDAIGTMLRAKQLVVVGDPKQLPPTSFFDRLGEDVEDDESTQFDNTESILEASMKVFQPFRRLRWHYRSKHESLIRFSNSRFYDNDLVVFPSCNGDSGAFGIQHIFVEDASFNGGVNLKEAQAVVEQIVQHALLHPDESLGVGTFNKKQSELIEELLYKRCEADSMASIAVDGLRDHDEKLFIKNLENLQGDERDVIFVCYTYGKDPNSGKMNQRFGPINSGTGWRRLNVLITRSRHRMVVFSSFMPSDVQGGPEKSLGVNAYKDFLQYATTGNIIGAGETTGRPPDSEFEVVVCRHIERMGLEAVPQVGVAGFFVDIGVRRREGDRSYLLGIECDGATYHSARSARDRDRLREEIIRSRGWHLHRIWSTDWFLNQKTEVEKLEAVVQSRLGEG